MKRLFLLVSLILLSLSSIQAQTTVTDAMLAEFEKIVVDEMAHFDVPGAAIAVIQGDEVIYAQGFGVRDVASGEPFTTETQFRIGSTTKSMTSLLIAQLVDEGLITWDTPVSALFPDFQTADPALTEQITVRDLMSMGTGLVSNTLDGLYWRDWDIDRLLTAISTQDIQGEYREFYAYNNEVYALAGYAATSATGAEPTLENYVDLMQSRVFDPIGMESAIITDDLSQLSDNYSESYESLLLNDEISLMGNPPIAFVAPSGGVWTNIEDMARYVITQMNSGITPDGERIVSEEALAETWQPGVPVDFEVEGMENTAYGMGWVVQQYQGVPVRFHDGGWAGYSTQMMILPEDDVALIIFANSTNGGFFGNMLNYVFIEVLHDLERQAVETTHSLVAELDAQLAQARPFISLDLGDVSGILGEYETGWTIAQHEDETLWMTGNGWAFQLGYIAFFDQYIILNNGAAGTFLSFDETGALVIEISETESISFARVD